MDKNLVIVTIVVVIILVVIFVIILNRNSTKLSRKDIEVFEECNNCSNNVFTILYNKKPIFVGYQDISGLFFHTHVKLSNGEELHVHLCNEDFHKQYKTLIAMKNKTIEDFYSRVPPLFENYSKSPPVCK